MAIIMKADKVEKSKANKQAYTWAACILIAVFVFAIAVPLISSGSKSTEDYRARAYDLAQLPFNNDEAEAALLMQDEYKDIPKNDLIGGLYSKEEKEERQAADAVNGVPAPADAEYKAAAVQKQRQTARVAARRAAIAPPTVTPTRTGSLTRGSMASSGGASSGMTAKVWTRDDIKTKPGSASTTDPRSQLLAKIGTAGRNTGFTDAYMKSSQAAKAKDAESMAAGSVDAFAKGVTADSAALQTELEKDAAELDMDNLGNKELSKNDLAAVDKATDTLDNEKRDNDRREIDACAGGMFGGGNFFQCFFGKIMDGIADGLPNMLFGLAKKTAGSDKTGDSGGKDNKVGKKA